MTTIFHNPRCSKSRETLALLDAKGEHTEIVEYLKTPPTPTELRTILGLLGISAHALLRTKEVEYKTLGLADSSLSEEAIISAMCEHPKLIERPIVIKNNQARIGRPPESVLDILS